MLPPPIPRRIQVRAGSISQWAANATVVLAKGEPAAVYYDASQGQYGELAGKLRGLKLGDGFTTFDLLPFVGEQAISGVGRTMRDLSGFGTLGSGVAGRDFASVHDAVVELLFPYSPPTFSLYGSDSHTLPVGSHTAVTLLLHNIAHGTFALREKRISDVNTAAVLNVVANGGAVVSDDPISAAVANLTLATAGLRTFRGSITNLRPAPEGNDTRILETSYEFRYPVAFGFTSADPHGFSDAQMSNLLFGSGSTFGTNLGGLAQHLAGSPANQRAVVAFAASDTDPAGYGNLGALSSITQAGQSVPILSTFDIQLNRLSHVATGNADFAFNNIRYRVYIQNQTSGAGSPTYYDCF